MNKAKVLALGLIALLSGAAYAAPSYLIVSGVAPTSEFGFLADQPITLTFKIDGAYSDLSGSDTSGGYNWNDNAVGSQIITSVSGAGLAGSLNTTTGYHSYIWLSSGGGPDSLSFGVYSDGSGMGLTTPNGTAITRFSIGTFGVTEFDFSGPLINPAAYLSAYEGYYASIPGSYLDIQFPGVDHYGLTLASIQVSPIPEPATSALLVSGVAFSLCALRRKRSARRVL